MSERQARPALCRVEVFEPTSGLDASPGDGYGPVEVSGDERPERCFAVRGRVGMSVGRFEAECACRPISVLVATPEGGVRSRPHDERVGGVDVPCRHGPPPGSAQVVPLAVEQGVAFSLARAHPQTVRPFHDQKVVLEMAVAEATGVGFETFFAVLAQRFEQPISHCGRAPFDEDHGLLDQRAEHIDDLRRFEHLVAAYGLRRGEVEAAGEHRHTMNDARSSSLSS